jgi:peroxiredoxin
MEHHFSPDTRNSRGAPVTAKPLEIGSQLPSFELPGPDSGIFRFGPNVELGRLIFFACNHCPFVRHIASCLGKLAAGWRDLGIELLAVNSNDVLEYPADSPDKMPDFASLHGWKFPYLFDEGQSVALAFGAQSTPDFFLFDRHNTLVYNGRFDGSSPRNDLMSSGEDLNRAIFALSIGEPIVNTPRSIGCSIKWRT